MQTFTDNAGRTWQVVINVAAIKRVRGALGIDLFKLADHGFRGLADVVGDPVQLVDVLYVLCQDQSQAQGISDEQFGGSMGGDVLVAAADAFVEALIGFFPDRRARDALRQVIDKGRKVRDLVLDDATKQIDAITPEQVASEMVQASTKPRRRRNVRGRGSKSSSANSPASSASTPTRGP